MDGVIKSVFEERSNLQTMQVKCAQIAFWPLSPPLLVLSPTKPIINFMNLNKAIAHACWWQHQQGPEETVRFVQKRTGLENGRKEYYICKSIIQYNAWTYKI